MQTKLTLRLDDALIRRAKRYAGHAGKSISQLVAEYFSLLDERRPPESGELPPRVRGLLGALRGAPATEADYRRHLEEKHR